MPLTGVSCYRQVRRQQTTAQALRTIARDTTVLVLSLSRSMRRGRGCIHFPYYHHVFDDERRDFGRHLRYFRQYGEFLSLDETIDILERGERLDGNYFCLTFDDGFRNCLSNALPLLVEQSCPATFYVPTAYINQDLATAWQRAQQWTAFTQPVEFLTWDDCREMMAAGMTIGAHTHSHSRLKELGDDQVREEMAVSKARIEEELRTPCLHFCCPWGIPGRDFEVERDPALARQLGFRSFVTTARGGNRVGADPFHLRRDHILAGWGNHQLRYFFGVS